MSKSKKKIKAKPTKYKLSCDICGKRKRPHWSFIGQDGKIHGACADHLEEVT